MTSIDGVVSPRFEGWPLGVWGSAVGSHGRRALRTERTALRIKAGLPYYCRTNDIEGLFLSMQIATKLFRMNGRHDWIRTSDLFRVKEAL